MKIVFQVMHCESTASNLIVNIIVHCRRTSTTLLPWQIAKIDLPTPTFESFFNDSIVIVITLGGYDGKNRFVMI